MALEVLWLLIGLAVGFFVAWYLYSKQKWTDKASALNEKWKRQLIELEKQYAVKLEKTNSAINSIKEENKTNIEKFDKQWRVKYIEDIEELRKLFKESEKIIKLKSVSSSRRSLVGKFIERFIPFLAKIPYEPSDMHFLGQPVDYIVFEGLHEDNIRRITFLEVKTGESKLTKREKSLKEAVEGRKVYWKEMHVDTSDEEVPDKEIEQEETSIQELYDHLEDKINVVKSNIAIAKTKKDDDSSEDQEEDEPLEIEPGEYTEECPLCGKKIMFDLSRSEVKSLIKGNKLTIRCVECGKNMTLDKSDFND